MSGKLTSVWVTQVGAVYPLSRLIHYFELPARCSSDSFGLN